MYPRVLITTILKNLSLSLWLFASRAIWALVLISLISCQKKGTEQKNPESSQLKRAIVALEHSEYELAIQILTQLYKETPTETMSLHLASAYAARAGIKAAEIWGMSIGYQTQSRDANSAAFQQIIETSRLLEKEFGNQERFFSQNKKHLSENLRIQLENEKNKFLKKLREDLRNTIAELKKFDQQVQKIPDISSSARADLEKAVEILRTQNGKASRLYSAALLAILTKRSFVDMAKVFDRWRESQFHVCSGDLNLFIRWLSYSLALAVEFSLDFQIAHPQYLPALEKFRSQAYSIRRPLNDFGQHQVQVFRCQ